MSIPYTIIFILLIVFTLLSGLVALWVYQNKNPDKNWKVQGLTIGFWGGAAVIGIVLTAITTFLLKWTQVIA